MIVEATASKCTDACVMRNRKYLVSVVDLIVNQITVEIVSSNVNNKIR